MQSLLPIIGILIGFALGFGAAMMLLRQTERQRQSQLDALVESLKQSFGNLSLEALSRSTEELLKLAGTRLESERVTTVKELDQKKGLIDQQLVRMTGELEKVSKLVTDLEKDRATKYGELTVHLKTTSEQTAALVQSTNTLREALASTKVRGQWGERMAEDVLRLAGFMEKINYLKQATIQSVGSRPDFTFLLPRDLKLHMDVKFPLDNYLRYLEAATDTDRAKFRADFLKDVRARIKECTTRDYINPEQNTVDSVLLFIPNEQVYSFIHEQDRGIFDEALRHKVVFCSPVTLFAILAVIRKAVDNFALEQTSNEILGLLGLFKKHWGEFLLKLETVGKRIGDAQKEYEALTTTRLRQLEKPLNKIEALRLQRDLPAPVESAQVLPLLERAIPEEAAERDR
ncbi:MAG TPA: DNA recombination protein RmuC [Nitrospirales bacterium]|nr:DNA recombination protein RmuC [Nitrospirales bacterium]